MKNVRCIIFVLTYGFVSDAHSAALRHKDWPLYWITLIAAISLATWIATSWSCALERASEASEAQ